MTARDLVSAVTVETIKVLNVLLGPACEGVVVVVLLNDGQEVATGGVPQPPGEKNMMPPVVAARILATVEKFTRDMVAAPADEVVDIPVMVPKAKGNG